MVHHFSDQGQDAWPPWLSRLARRLGRLEPPHVLTNHYLYHDWSAVEFRRVPSGRDAGQDFAVGPRDLAILTPTPAGGTLTVWDLPPPRRPWPWSVPAGVALGVLTTAAVVRLRRRARDDRPPSGPPPL